MNFKKKVFHVLTSGNADIAFYTEVFVNGNKERIMRNPFRFGFELLVINIKCRIPNENNIMKDLVPGKKRIARILKRPKVYQYATAFIRYPYIITDLFGSLLELSVDMDSIFMKIEEEYMLPGFQKLRREKENPYKTIASIYEEISRELGVTITKDVEITMLERHLFFNPYLHKVLEIAAYNQNKIIAVLESSYSREDMIRLVGECSSWLTDVYVSCETQKAFHQMEKDIHKNNPNMGEYEDQFAVVSGNYKKAIKKARRYHFVPLYYRSAREIMKSVPLPKLTKEFREVYQTVAGMELFSGMYNHKIIYETTYLFLAPTVYALLEETRRMAEETGGTVLALCDSQCIFIKLYEKFFGTITNCIWSEFAGSIPASQEEWNKLVEETTYLGSFPADRIAHACGFSFQSQSFEHCREEFAKDAMIKARYRNPYVIKEYLQQNLNKETNIVVVDPMPGFSALSMFCQYVNEMNPQMNIAELSLSRFLNKDAGELLILQQMLQMDIPYVMGLYGKDKLEEISFVQPKLIHEIKKKIIVAALEDFCREFVSYKEKNREFNVCASDVNALLDYSKEGLTFLEEELGDWIG